MVLHPKTYRKRKEKVLYLEMGTPDLAPAPANQKTFRRKYIYMTAKVNKCDDWFISNLKYLKRGFTQD